MLNNMTNKIHMLYKKFESWFEKEWGWFLTNGNQNSRKALQKKRTEIKTIEKIHDDLSTI